MPVISASSLAVMVCFLLLSALSWRKSSYWMNEAASQARFEQACWPVCPFNRFQGLQRLRQP